MNRKKPTHKPLWELGSQTLHSGEQKRNMNTDQFIIICLDEIARLARNLGPTKINKILSFGGHAGSLTLGYLGTSKLFLQTICETNLSGTSLSLLICG